MNSPANDICNGCGKALPWKLVVHKRARVKPRRQQSDVQADETGAPLPVAILEIASFVDEEGYYLFEISANGEEVNDWKMPAMGYLESAAAQLYGVRPEDWVDVSPPSDCRASKWLRRMGLT